MKYRRVYFSFSPGKGFTGLHHISPFHRGHHSDECRAGIATPDPANSSPFRPRLALQISIAPFVSASFKNHRRPSPASTCRTECSTRRRDRATRSKTTSGREIGAGEPTTVQCPSPPRRDQLNSGGTLQELDALWIGVKLEAGRVLPHP
jgi:hypothetical protein